MTNLNEATPANQFLELLSERLVINSIDIGLISGSFK